MTYQEPADLKRDPKLVSLSPPEAQVWLAFDHSIEREDGQIPRKYRELMAVAASLTAQCAYCIDQHVRAAKRLGVTPAEIAEAVMIAAEQAPLSRRAAGAGRGHGGGLAPGICTSGSGPCAGWRNRPYRWIYAGKTGP
ncbi:carboxymuconolactone decarboxylase family protein [Fibrella sp. HMF5036]|uniref:Carboxymuconolactone decarboxylase family protein n=1 Tax=Fibrella aquatilis TaxID=2817059 RepID=A0A939FZW1_9BACT|nr:carboxymuconolactone decarboxylase family protein [Fibrella aquatilis]